MCRFSRLRLLLFSFFFCKDGSDRLMKRASYSCCSFLCIVLAAAYLKYRLCRLSCLPFVWHPFFIVTHTHTLVHLPEGLLCGSQHGMWPIVPCWKTIHGPLHLDLECLAQTEKLFAVIPAWLLHLRSCRRRASRARVGGIWSLCNAFDTSWHHISLFGLPLAVKELDWALDLITLDNEVNGHFHLLWSLGRSRAPSVRHWRSRSWCTFTKFTPDILSNFERTGWIIASCSDCGAA